MLEPTGPAPEGELRIFFKNFGNLKRKGFRSDKEIRQALNDAIPRDPADPRARMVGHILLFAETHMYREDEDTQTPAAERLSFLQASEDQTFQKRHRDRTTCKTLSSAPVPPGAQSTEGRGVLMGIPYIFSTSPPNIFFKTVNLASDLDLNSHLAKTKLGGYAQLCGLATKHGRSDVLHALILTVYLPTSDNLRADIIDGITKKLKDWKRKKPHLPWEKFIVAGDWNMAPPGNGKTKDAERLKDFLYSFELFDVIAWKAGVHDHERNMDWKFGPVTSKKRVKTGSIDRLYMTPELLRMTTRAGMEMGPVRMADGTPLESVDYIWRATDVWGVATETNGTPPLPAEANEQQRHIGLFADINYAELLSCSSEMSDSHGPASEAGTAKPAGLADVTRQMAKATLENDGEPVTPTKAPADSDPGADPKSEARMRLNKMTKPKLLDRLVHKDLDKGMRSKTKDKLVEKLLEHGDNGE